MTTNPQNIINTDLHLMQVVLPFCYFDLFSHPLHLEEIYHFSRYNGLTKDRIKLFIDQLVAKEIIYCFGEYYAMSNKPEWVNLRMEYNTRAQLYKAKAQKMAKLIAKFPFVKAVFVSGSLSKEIMHENGDIDYFIITRKNCLWMARTFLILYKKIFLFNSHKYFCLNYFIDENHLEIEEQNIFTATEISTLLPMYGHMACQNFYNANSWVNEFLPNHPQRPINDIALEKDNWSTKFLSKIVESSTGKKLEVLLMNVTLAFWKRKFNDFDKQTFEKAFKSRPYISKHHPLNFQAKVLAAYTARKHNFEEKYKVIFDEKN